MQVELVDSDGNTAWAEYSSFHILGESSGYKLTVSGYTGTAGDTGKDRDNDLHDSFNCDIYSKGAWWFSDCIDSLLAVEYVLDGVNVPIYRRMIWGNLSMLCLNWSIYNHIFSLYFTNIGVHGTLLQCI